MNQEFSLSTFSKIFYGLFVAAIVGFAIFLFLKIPASNNGTAGIVIVVILLIAATVLGLYTINRNITITTNEITVTGMFGSKQLNKSDIKGFRIIDKAILIIPHEELGLKKLTINDYSAIGNTDGLVKCLTEHYPDLDAIDYQNELNEVLQDNNLGFSEDERIAKLRTARQVSLSYNIGAIILFALLIFATDFTMQNKVIGYVMLIYPLVGIIIILTSNGLIKLITKKTSVYYHIYFGLFFPAIMISIKSAVFFHIIHYQNIWLPTIFIALFFFVLIYVRGMVKEESRVKGQVILALITAVIYSYGFTLTINCQFDQSKPKAYTTNIVKAYIYHGKRNVPRVILNSWDGDFKSKDLQIGKDLYDQLSSRQSLHVYEKTGLLNIPWFYIDL